MKERRRVRGQEVEEEEEERNGGRRRKRVRGSERGRERLEMKN